MSSRTRPARLAPVGAPAPARPHWGFRAWASVLALALAGCSARHYRESADKAAYGTIAAKSRQVVNMDPHFTLDQTNTVSLDELPKLEQAAAFLGSAGEIECGAAVLSLDTALGIAVHHSRVYQNSKEQLYLAALSYTLSRHQFAPLFSGSGSVNYAVQTEKLVRYEIDEITGKPKPIISDDLVEQSLVRADGSVGVSWLLRDIGRISAAFTSDFTRFLASGGSSAANSQLGATFTRPLLRNAGYKRDLESLTQSERNLLYQVRDFVRFRKSFSVNIARDYYNILSSRDACRNAFLRLGSARRNREQIRALAQEGRRTQSDLGRLETDELTAESNWIEGVRNYKQSLDNFKIKLGLPVDALVVLDDRELTELVIHHPNIKVEDSIRVALEARLDYQNQHDQFADSQRQVKLAADALKTQVDLNAAASISSPPQQTSGFPVPDPNRYRWNAGLIVDLPFERTAERNAYRQALIAQEQAARALSQRHDEIELEVRDSWRTLEQAKRTFEINDIGVKLAERRVEEQELLAEIGRARAQDQVDAQTALLQSRNARTQALVGHTIARLQFWDNMGILYIKDNGQWEELENAKAP